MIRTVRRGVGYCIAEECKKGFSGIFILNPDEEFYCSYCRKKGIMDCERSEVSGEGEDFYEVRVEFDFVPRKNKHKSIAIVKDNGGPGKTYTLYSPTIRTKRAALQKAESLLGQLRGDAQISGGDIISADINILDLAADDKTFDKQLDKIKKKWRVNDLGTKE
jgi:hypothetical protein